MTTTPKLEKTKTPGIYKRGGSFVVTYRDPFGRKRKKFAPTYSQARALKAAIATDVVRGEFRETTQVRFEEYARAWILSYAGRTSNGIRPETRLGYERLLEQDAIPLFRGRRLCDIDAAALDELAARVASGPLCRECRGAGYLEVEGLCMKCRGLGRIAGTASAPGTVRQVLAPVKALLATAVQRKDLRMNPVAGYRTRFEVKPHDELDVERVKALSEAELRALLDAIEAADDTERWRPFFEFLAQTGLRIGEAVEVRWKDIDIGKQTLRVSRRFYRDSIAAPKSKYGRRTIRLSPAMAQRFFKRNALEKPGPEDLVWQSDRGKRIDQSNLSSRVLKPAARASGVGDWVGYHTFRHSCATMLFRRGFNAVQVQRWLGHHKPSFTLDTYVHLLDEDLPEATFLDEMVGDRWAPSPTETPSRHVQVIQAETRAIEPVPESSSRVASA